MGHFTCNHCVCEGGSGPRGLFLNKLCSDLLVSDFAENITVVVPTAGDTEAVRGVLLQLQALGLRWIVVQAQDSQTSASAVPTDMTLHGQWLGAPASRGGQIAAGIAQCATDWVWVVHDDSEFDESAVDCLKALIEADQPMWGRFDVQFREQTMGLRLVASLMNTRSRLSKICTGDQGMFFHCALLTDIGGFPAQPLMEDIEVSKQLKRRAAKQFVAAREVIVTSGQRWLVRGFWSTIMSMWSLRLHYYFGAKPAALYERYYGRRS